MQMLRLSLGHLPRHGGWFFRGFCTLHHPYAPAFLGTFTWKWGLFFFGLSAHYTMQMLWIFFGHLPGHQGCFLGVFRTVLRHVLHFYLCVTHLFMTLTHENYLSTSCRCSWFSQDIYLDTRVVFFSGFSHISGTCTASLHIVSLFYFEYLAMRLCVYILQMLWKFCIFAGHLPGHHGCFLFWFSTHPQNMYCIFTYVWHIYCLCTSCRCTCNFAFSWEIDLDNRVVFFGGFLRIPRTCIKWCPTNSQ